MADSQRKTANLFNKETALANKAISDTSGALLNMNGLNASDYILVSGMSKISITNTLSSRWGAFYDDNKVFVSGFNGYGTVNVPQNATYLRITVLDAFLDSCMANEGNSLFPYEPYWKHSLRKLTTATEAVENPLYSDGTAITAYTIKGNTVQSGTPTPSSPVAVNGVGERTENLWDEQYLNISSTLIYKPIYVGAGEYTLSTTVGFSDNAAVLFLLAGNVQTGASSAINGVGSDITRTVTAVDGYVTIAYRKYAGYNPEEHDTMLNSGSTAKPYEPYGIKIPISSGGVTNNIYLGSATSNRQIKKLVLDGTETGWDKGTYAFYYTISDMYIRSQVICTHYDYYDGTSSSAPTNSISTASGVGTSIWIKTADHDTTTIDQWKAYLQAQYAAGTPVTVWYVLATATTGVVNEPLMKIGDYADSISNAATIPTTDGANTITVDTTVQPSEFSATWTGWHDSSVKEYDGTDWQ